MPCALRLGLVAARVTSWTCSPEAVTLLASCARWPPRRRLFVFRFGETAFRFIGRRVGRLRRLYRLAEPPVDTLAWREWLSLDPQQAIEQALARTETESMDESRPDPLRRHNRMIAAFCDDLASPDYRDFGRTPRADALSGRASSSSRDRVRPLYGGGRPDEWQV